MVDLFIGTRPEAIKMCPVVLALKESQILVRVILTGQHEQLGEFLDSFGVIPDIKMRPPPVGQSLLIRTCVMMKKIDFLLKNTNLVIVQGDTSTVFAAAMAAFMEKIPIVHIEAGLRTKNLFSPFPEEGFRQMVSRVATVNFAPTDVAIQNLLTEGISKHSIEMVGNTVVDALRLMKGQYERIENVPNLSTGEDFVLVTCHRRENWGEHAERLANFVRYMSDLGMAGVVVKHPNPEASRPFEDGKIGNFTGISSVPYKAMLALVNRATMIVTDSGGLVEEGGVMGCPVAIFRDTTERMEAVFAGSARLSFTTDALKNNLSDVLSGNWKPLVSDVFGDGYSSQKIVESLRLRGLV